MKSFGAASTLKEELEELREKSLYRKIRTLSPVTGTRAEWEGRELLLFCGNDYLGLSHHPQVIEAGRRALEEYGVGAGAARLISGSTDPHARLEEGLASFKRKDRALLFGSGYLANLGVLTALAEKNDLIVLDKLCHASLIDGARLSQATLRVFPHKDYKKMREILERQNGITPYRRRILVSDAVFSMDGDRADLCELIRLRDEYDALLVVDDAHGLGVFGPTGRGATEDLEEKIDVIIGTLSKALGVFGGFAAASNTFIEYLINVSRPFLFATAPPPALAEAALASLRLLETDAAPRRRLWQHVDRLLEGLTRQGIFVENRSPIIPLRMGEEKRAVEVSERLLRKGILIPAVRYPTVPKGRARLRLTLSAAHTEEDLDRLLQTLKEVLV